ncbi:MAG: CheR family methyltransferase [Myxococcaceae bacterium]
MSTRSRRPVSPPRPRHSSPPKPPAPPAEEPRSPALRQIGALLKSRLQVDVSGYKTTTLKRRIERRMSIEGFDTLEAYAEALQGSPDGLNDLHDELFIHVTQFFRDLAAFNAVKEKVLAPLFETPRNEPLRIWVPGCSTGEEVYSLCIAACEVQAELSSRLQLQLFATDISESAVAQARRAVYAPELLEAVSPERRERFFDPVEGGFKVKKALRDLCIFSRHDVTAQPPFARLDLISCRNVLIYFDAELQKRVMPVFHYALRPGGYLWLGQSESVGTSSKLFRPVDKLQKIFCKTEAPAGNRLFRAATAYGPSQAAQPAGNGLDLKRSADDFVLARYAPPGVVIDAELEVVQYRGKTTPWLSAPSGAPTQSLTKLAHPELVSALRNLVQTVKRGNTPSRHDGLSVDDHGTTRKVSVEVTPLNVLQSGRERQFLVLFEEEAPSRRDAADGKKGHKGKGGKNGKAAKKTSAAKGLETDQLIQELDALREHQQVLTEQFNASQEELTSANEELQATNEELQSTNEELETAKEELQAAIEELTSLNTELTSRNTELLAANEALKKGEDRFRLLVESVKDYAIYMLDPEGRVNSWNEGARRLKGYEASEILGHHYSRFFTPDDHDAQLPQLELERARIDGRFEVEGWRVRKDGSRFWANVIVSRINDSTGRLLGFSKVTRDLTERRKAEEAMRRANEGLEVRVKDRTAELEKALKTRDVFLSIASHELKTPLTSLSLQLQMGLRGLKTGRKATPEHLAEVLERAVRQSMALGDLIDGLLDVSRIQAGRFELELSKVSVAELCEEIAGRFAPLLAQTQTPLELKLDRALEARWDKRRIGQVLANLLSNAVKYAQGKPVTLAAAAGPAGTNGIRLTVADNGPGIALDRQPHIFERFERAGAASNIGGLGLGLFIARRIVEAHGGTVKVESDVGKGATFVLDLPAQASPHNSLGFEEGQ